MVARSLQRPLVADTLGGEHQEKPTPTRLPLEYTWFGAWGMVIYVHQRLFRHGTTDEGSWTWLN
jgi:hypothetical protein